MNKPNALLIEDDVQIRHFLRTALEKDHWRVFEAGSMRDGEHEIADLMPDLILLDLGLPDGDGVSLIVRIRKTSDTPIIVLSARSQESDKVRALDAGADDYLTKPFGLAEFLARIRVVQRRLLRLQEKDKPLSFSFGDIEVDLSLRVVKKAVEPLHLTPIEYRMLLALIETPGRVLTHRELLRQVWGPARHEQLHLVRIHMSNLRGKVERDPSQPRYIITEAGVGYRLIDAASETSSH
jgi:two-component system KDP operon response regulator KdpE